MKCIDAPFDYFFNLTLMLNPLMKRLIRNLLLTIFSIIPIRRISFLHLLLATIAVPMIAGAEEANITTNILPPGPYPIEVQARFFLSDINDINELTETFEIKGILALQWHDERYVFDPNIEGVNEKRYQGTFQFLEEYNAWWPQLVLSNGVGTIPLQSVSLKNSPDGTLLFLQEITAIVESPMDLRLYPFDEQKLKAIFEPLAYSATEIRLVTGPEMIDIPDRPIHVAGWELSASSVEPHVEKDENSDALFTQFIMTLKMKRKPGFVIWFMIVPLSMIVLLSNAVFWINRELIGNRLDILFIGLLTIVAYQSLAAESLPSVSYFTLINGFVYVGYLTMIASIVSNVWLYNLNRLKEEAKAKRFNQMCRWVIPTGFLGFNLILFLYFYSL
jgi:hypothetical protein